MKKIILVLLLVLTLGLVACNGGNDDGKFVVGMECAYAPFNWTETEKTETNVPISNLGKGAYAEGYDVQVAKIIAEELGLELEIKALAWDALIENLNSGGIDMIIAGMSPTAERLESIDFTAAYYESTHVLLLKKDSPYAQATTLAGFAGAKVIGQTGTIYADLVPQAVAAGAVAGNNLSTVPLIIQAILNDTVDATIVEEPVAKGICSQYDNLTYVKLTDGFNVADEDKIVSIGVRKGYELTAQINEVLQNVLTESVRTQLMEQAIANAPTEE